MLQSSVFDALTGNIVQVIQYQNVEFYFGQVLGALSGMIFWLVAKDGFQ